MSECVLEGGVVILRFGRVVLSWDVMLGCANILVQGLSM